MKGWVMNFLVQSLIQDLENMGRFPQAVSVNEWREKWTTLSQLSPAEHEAVMNACQTGSRKAAWDLVQKHDPDPAKTQRAAAFDGFFKT